MPFWKRVTPRSWACAIAQAIPLCVLGRWRRRSEVVLASVENTRRVGAAYAFTLTHSKTNQSGADRAENDKPVAGRAAHAMTAWLAAANRLMGFVGNPDPLEVHRRATTRQPGAIAPVAINQLKVIYMIYLALIFPKQADNSV